MGYFSEGFWGESTGFFGEGFWLDQVTVMTVASSGYAGGQSNQAKSNNRLVNIMSPTVSYDRQNQVAAIMAVLVAMDELD